MPELERTLSVPNLLYGHCTAIPRAVRGWIYRQRRHHNETGHVLWIWS